MHVEARGQPHVSPVGISPTSFETGSLAGLTGWPVNPGIFLCWPPQSWNYRYTSLTWTLIWMLGIKLRLPCFQSNFADGAISLDFPTQNSVHIVSISLLAHNSPPPMHAILIILLFILCLLSHLECQFPEHEVACLFCSPLFFLAGRK